MKTHNYMITIANKAQTNTGRAIMPAGMSVHVSVLRDALNNEMEYDN